jgi:hypothetical protein
MKINQDKLTIIYETENISENLYKVKGEESITLDASTYLYIGFRKPLTQLFFEIKTANTNDVELVVEKYTTDWTAVDHADETNGLKESDFLFLSDIDSENKTTVEGEELYWIRISADSATSATELRMINLLLNSEEDLVDEEPDIAQFYPDTIDSHVYSLVSAKKYILRKINNGGMHKYNSTDLRYYQMNVFDVFDINELREASTYYALYKIYHNISEADDNYKQKATDYLEKFQSSFALFSDAKLSMDKEDDGEESREDNKESVQTVKLVK